MSNYDDRIPSRLVIIAGTYDGVLAGWDTVEHAGRPSDEHDIDLKLLRRNDGRHLKLSFAMAAHEGSVRCIDVAGAPPAPTASENGKKSKKKKRQRSDDSVDGDNDSTTELQQPEPGNLLSGGYDESINVFSLQKHAQVGELKTPNDLGSPMCSSFAPPSRTASSTTSATTSGPTHALVGTTSGKIVLYKKRDWSVQHVLSGHDSGGVSCLAVHPSGRMALTGGRSDGKLILWDLMKGRLAFVHKLPKSTMRGRSKESVNHIVWSEDGTRYAFCYGTKITARDVGSGETLLDVDMPSRVNQLAFVGGPEGMFVAAACDDGGLPVLEVGQLEETDDANERRAIMAIEPVDGVVAGDDRFKCIRSVEGGSGFLVVTANSGGVISLMDLEGAARMMLTGGGGDDGEGEDEGSGSESEDSKSDDGSDEEVEAAVEILDSVRLGSGARITDLAVWSYGGEGGMGFDDIPEDESDALDKDLSDEDEAKQIKEDSEDEGEDEPPAKKKTKKGGSEKEENRNHSSNKIELDAEAVEKARKLVGQAKKRQKKEKRKKTKKL